MDRLGSLHAFVQAAEKRSFTVAGRQMGVSSSAVGKAVARLEERLSVRLFHRSTRSITLTAEGTLFLNRCHTIIDEMKAAEGEMKRNVEEPRGRLRVGMPQMLTVLMPSLVAFARRYPDVELDLDFTDRVVDVIDEGFDVVFRAGAATDSRLMTRSLGTFRYRVVGTPAYFADHSKPRQPADLRDHHCLRRRLPSTGKCEIWPLSENGELLDLPLHCNAVVSTFEPLVMMAEQGLGLACVPSFVVDRRIADGTFEAVLDEHLSHEEDLRILWPSSRHLSPKVKRFVNHIAADRCGITDRDPVLRDAG